MRKNHFGLWVAAFVLFAAPAARGQQDPLNRFIVAADSVHMHHSAEDLQRWLALQPPLAGAAAAQLIDVAVELGDAGDAANEAGNIALVEALAAASSQNGGESPLSHLLAAYRAWDAEARALRAATLAAENDAWSTVGADPAAALQAFVEADSTYARIDDPHSRARVWGRIGAARWYLGDGDGVRDAYLEALRRRRAVGDRQLEAATLNGMGSLHYRFFGDLEGALDWYAQAAVLRRTIGDEPGLATSLTYAANVLTELGRIVEARAHYEEARPVLESLGDGTRLVENLHGTATLYRTVGRNLDALRLYEEALALCMDTEGCGHAPTILVEWADALTSTGRLQEATTILDRADALEMDSATATRLSVQRAVIAQALGDQDVARSAMSAARRHAAATEDPALQADTTLILSGLYLNLGARDRARNTAEEALELAVTLENPVLQRAAHFALGNVALSEGNAAEGIEQYSRGLRISEDTQSWSRAAHDLLGRSGAHSLANRMEEARADARRAARLFEESGQEWALWYCELNIGDSFEKTDPESASVHYDAALDALEENFRNTGGSSFQTGYLFADQGRAYEEVTRFYASLHESDPDRAWDDRAFRTSERSRARGLRELLDLSFAEVAGDEVDTIFDALYSLDPSTPAGRAERSRLQARLTELRRQAKGGEEIGVLTLEQVQAALEPSDVVLHYAVGDSATFLWRIRTSGVDLYELPAREELRRRVKRFRDAIAQPGDPRATEVLWQEGHDLYEVLVAEATRDLADESLLVIVPDDVLLELPFEALLENDHAVPWSQAPFFGRSRDIAYAPSTSVFLELRERRASNHDRDLLAVGDVDYSGAPESLEPLPFTREEVEAISAGAQRAEILLGGSATESQVRAALATRSPRIIHLATHGLIDARESSRSSIALGIDADSDGRLTVMEILALRLKAPMIVLSACESARGRLERGEGVLGLSRSFLAAGSRGVVASLWPVSDASTAALMQEFYAQVWAGESAPRSLRHARTALLTNERWSHPYFWAPFIPVGSPSMPW